MEKELKITDILQPCSKRHKDCICQLQKEGEIWCDTRVDTSFEVLPCEEDEEESDEE